MADSTPSIERLVKQVLVENTSLALDAILFGTASRLRERAGGSQERRQRAHAIGERRAGRGDASRSSEFS